MANIDFSKFNRNKASEHLSRAKESAGEGGTGTWASVLDVSKAPRAFKWWKPTAGTHYIDIIGTEVTNPKNPAVRSGSIEIGDFDFGLTIWTHPDPKGGGPKALPHVCLKRNGYAQSCPRCEEFFKTYVKGQKGSGNSIHRSSERTFMIIVPREDKKTPGTEAFLWETSVHDFTSELLEEANVANDGKPTFFWWPTDDGKTIEFRATPGDLPNSFEFKGFKFHDRPESVGKRFYEQFTFPLDSIVRIPTASQIEAEIYGAPDEEEEETSAQASTGTRHDEYKREEKEVPDTKRNDPDLDFNKPTPGTDKVPKGEGAKQALDAMGMDGYMGEAKASKSTGACPHGLEFGKSFLETPEPRACRTCDKYDPCVAAG